MSACVAAASVTWLGASSGKACWRRRWCRLVWSCTGVWGCGGLVWSRACPARVSDRSAGPVVWRARWRSTGRAVTVEGSARHAGTRYGHWAGTQLKDVIRHCSRVKTTTGRTGTREGGCTGADVLHDEQMGAGGLVEGWSLEQGRRGRPKATWRAESVGLDLATVLQLVSVTVRFGTSQQTARMPPDPSSPRPGPCASSSLPPSVQQLAGTVTPAFDQPRTPALPLPIVCHLLGSGNQLHPTGLYQPALPLCHRTPSLSPSCTSRARQTPVPVPTTPSAGSSRARGSGAATTPSTGT